MIASLWQALRERPSVGEQAWEFVHELHARDRWSTFPQYNESSTWCAETLRALGVVHVERVAFPADGKIVFTPRHPPDIKALVAQRGGIGIISDWIKAKDLPDERQWINTWSDAPGGWAMHAHDAPLWGFMLPPREGGAIATSGAGERGRAAPPTRACGQPSV
ncbi:MAG: hypothetical protein NZT92_09795 [Abditibacteriales bacterium]|nr:hypothetical protein [Abditibacteriales bacterium]